MCFLCSWYKEITPDMDFVQEIRLLIRDLTANLIIRLNKVKNTYLL